MNPGHYRQTYRGESINSDDQSYAQAVIKKAAEIGVSVLAITDHNNVEGVSAFKDAAVDYDITIFPGFEITSSEGIHILCIYPQDSSDEQLGRYLGYFGIQGLEPSTDLADKTFTEIISEVSKQGGIAIAAHTTTENGLFKELSGQARIRAWQHEDLLAVQIPSTVNDLDHNYRQIVLNKNPDYSRSHNVAAINAKDISKTKDVEDLSATCWIKMSRISIEGLRQAFLDPESRIRLNNDPTPDEHTELVSVAWEGGFLGGTSLQFNSNLNVLVGGRGAGKSAIIESLRYVLDMKPVGQEANTTHEGIVKNVIRGGTKISLMLRSLRPAKQEYLIERIVNNPPIVRDSSRQISNLKPADILPRIEVYGQHEISELTRSPEKLTNLLERFVNHDDELKQRKDTVRRNLQSTRKSIAEASVNLDEIDEQLAALPSLQEKLNRFKQAGLEDQLSDQSLLVKEEGVINSTLELVEAFRRDLESVQQKLPIERTFLSSENLAPLPGGEILGKANYVIRRLSEELETIVQISEAAIGRADTGLSNIQEEWEERKRNVETDYHRILRNLGEAAVDGEDFIRLQRDIENLLPLHERRVRLDMQINEYKKQRQSLLADWEDIKAKEFRILDRAAKKVSRNLKNQVQVEVIASANKAPLVNLLRERIGGRLSNTIEKIEQTSDFSLPRFIETCRKGG